MPGDKRSFQERVEHIAAIEKAMVQGRTARDIVRACTQQFSMTARQVKRDMALVRKRWAEGAARIKATPGEQLGLAVARREHLFSQALDLVDLETALKAEQDRCKLLNLYPAVDSADAECGRATNGPALSRYKDDPVGYARDVLKVTPTPDQERIARAVLEPPYRVLVKSGHNIGKTFLAAWLVNWWYDTRNPGVVISTAPDARSVSDVLWTEIRLQRQRSDLPSPFAPKAPLLRDPANAEDHWAKGYTAASGEGFQGRHRERMLFVFDEAEGVDAAFWRTTESMFQPDGNCAWITILNPTTTTSQSYLEEQTTGPDGLPKWRIFSLSALDHPNIAAGLANREKVARGEKPDPLPVPAAVTLEQVEGWLNDWFEPIPAGEIDPDLDIEFPKGSGKWYRPDPDGEARVLGRRPTAGSCAVWTERLWKRACETTLNPVLTDIPEIGCDVARYGDDKTEIHSRVGPCSLEHEEHGGWDTVRVADRLMERADQLAKWYTDRRPPQAVPLDPKTIRIKVDDTGVGGGVTDILRSHGYGVVAVNSGEAADSNDRYPRVRDELWFSTKDRAKAGKLDLTRLPEKVRATLQIQALAPIWWPTPDRRRTVEPKEKTKERIGRSPDGMDAVNLAYYEAADWGVPTVTHQ